MAADRAVREPLDESGAPPWSGRSPGECPDPALPGPLPARPPRRRSSTPGAGAPVPSSRPGSRAPGSPRSLDRSPPWQPTGPWSWPWSLPRVGRRTPTPRCVPPRRPRHAGPGCRSPAGAPRRSRRRPSRGQRRGPGPAPRPPRTGGRPEPGPTGRAAPGAGHDRRGRARSRARTRAGPASRSGNRRAPPSTVRGRSTPRRARRGRGPGPGRTQDLAGTGGRRCSPASCRPCRSSRQTRSGSSPPRARFSQTTPGGDVGPATQEATPRVLPAPVGADTRVTIPPVPTSRRWLSPSRGSVHWGTTGTPARARGREVELGTSNGEAHGDLGRSGSTGTRIESLSGVR